MSKIITTETVIPSKLTPEERQDISESLYKVHTRIFEGLNEKEFDHYVVNSPAKATKIFIYRDKIKKEIIGYFSVHRFEKVINDRPLVIFRAEAGLIPEFRHKNADINYWFIEALKFKIFHPNKETFYLVCPVNPSVYARFAKYIFQIYPKYKCAVPPYIENIMMQLADEFCLKKVENPFVRKVGWITEATEEEKLFWQGCNDPHIRYYINLNPGFNKGSGVLTLIPLTFLNLFVSFFSFLIYYTIKRKVRYKFRYLLHR